MNFNKFYNGYYEGIIRVIRLGKIRKLYFIMDTNVQNNCAINSMTAVCTVGLFTEQLNTAMLRC